MRFDLKSTVGAALVVLVAGCDSLSPIEPGPNTPLTGYIDGEEFIATSANSTITPATVTIEASSGTRSIRFEFNNLGPNNYFIGEGNPVRAEVVFDGATWVAEGEAGGGTVTVTDLISTFISGQFDFTLVRESDGQSIEVSVGRFILVG